MFFGNTDPKKNTFNTLRGYLKYARENKEPLPLVLIDFSREQLLKVIPEVKGKEHLFVFPGYIPNNELPKIFNAAEVFLYTSLRESFGIPLLEGMKSRTPVIASNTSSLPEIGGEAVYYVNPRCQREIAKAIEEVCFSKKIQNELIEKGVKRAPLFCWENTAKGMLNLYEESYE